MIHPARTTSPRRWTVPAIFPLLLGVVFALAGAMTPHAGAAPAPQPSTAHTTAQNVDWMSPEMASRLDIGMDVLVPSWIPAPFTGVQPSVSASPGYYQLYWMVGGGAPTFLYIEGVAGGSLPAGSPADLNKQLSINASVQGWQAIHDIGIPAGGSTPIYDQVWWIANGVLYTVSSNNMTGSDSLSLANSLVVLQPPASQAPPPVEAPPAEVPQAETPGEPVGETWEEPAVSQPETTDSATSNTVTEPRSVDTGTVPEAGGTTSIQAPESGVSAPLDTTEPSSSARQPWSPGRGDGDVPSDGTNGPVPPVMGGDGTGGWFDSGLPAMRGR